MTHPQLLNDMATLRARSRVVAGFLVKVAGRIDPSVVPATWQVRTPALNV